jgi:patatin-like phospholipase/acyl hydrolase
VPERFQILSLSGGGIRGLYTISVLATIEEFLADESGVENYNIADHFSLISGTSIGGILALGLASGINARKLQKLLDDNRKLIFPYHWQNRIPFLAGLLLIIKRSRKSLYDSAALHKLLNDTFTNKRIGDLNTAIIIPTVNGTTGLPRMFKTPHHENFVRDYKHSLVDVALATTAAPTYLDPHLFDHSYMVDGGLIANSPAFIACHEATNFLNKDKAFVHLLSIGTMGSQTALKSEKNNKWGYLNGWRMGKTLLELTLSSNEGMHNFITKQILGENFNLLDDNNTPDQSEVITLDNSSDAAAQMLRSRGINQGQNALGDKNIKAFFKEKAQSPHFYRK